MADIYLNPGALAQSATNVRKAAEHYMNAVNDIETKVKDLTGSSEWRGKDTSAYGQAVLNKIPKMRELAETIVNYANNLDVRADELMAASSGIAGQASNL